MNNTKINVEFIDINLLAKSKSNVRKNIINDTEWATFKNSIQENGIIIPLLVRQTSDNEYTILAGERRYTAAKELGYSTVPAIMYDGNLSDEEIILIENVLRKDINDVDQAETFKKLYLMYGSFSIVARKTGFTASHIGNMIKLLDNLNEEQLEAVKTGKVSKNIYSEAMRLKRENEIYFNLIMDSSTKQILVNAMKVRSIVNFIKLNPSVDPIYIEELIYNSNFTEDHINLLLTVNNRNLRKQLFDKVLEDELSIRSTIDYLNLLLEEQANKLIDNFNRQTQSSPEPVPSGSQIISSSITNTNESNYDKEEDPLINPPHTNNSNLKESLISLIRNTTIGDSTSPRISYDLMGDILTISKDLSKLIVKYKDKDSIYTLTKEDKKNAFNQLNLLILSLEDLKQYIISEKETKLVVIEGFKKTNES